MPAKSVSILVTTSIGSECIRHISAVSPRIKPVDVSALAYAEQKGDFSSQECLNSLLAEAEVIFGLQVPKNVISRAPKLKWIQSMSAGMEHILDSDMVSSHVVVTNTSGIHAVPMAESVLGLMLMFVKHAPSYFALKRKRQWKVIIPSVLRSKTIGIVGLGSIGREVAKLAKAFGMRVVATRRSTNSIARAKNVDAILPSNQLHKLLSESDFAVLTLPCTRETNKLIGKEELQTMKPTAYLINVARGNIVHEEVLIRALEEGWIAGAGLDVFATEPLPKESKLWKLPNVILSPHVTGDMVDYDILATELFCDNLSRYINGEKLLKIVAKRRGY